MIETQNKVSISTTEKAAYGILSFGKNLAAQMISLFLMIFYTDVFGIPVHFISAMFLIFSIWEGCSKQLVGFFMGITQPRHGKYRPYLLWTIVPYAVFSVAIFIAPDLSDTYKVLYAYCTYFIWAAIGNIISVAQNSIMPMMSKDQLERTQINSLKVIFSVLSSILVSSLALKLVDIIGGGNHHKGYLLTVLGISVIGVIIQCFSYRNIRERHSSAEGGKISVKVAIDSISDKRLIIFFLAYCAFWIACTFKNQSTTYYFKYVLEQPDYTGTFFMIGTTSSFIMHFFIKRIVSYIKVETAIIIGTFGSILGVLVMYAAGNNLMILSFGNIVFGLMSAMPANLVFIVLAGYVDEKNNRYKANVSSWLYASMDNLAKIGVGIGGAVFSGLLNIFGYEPNVQQAPSALFGIRLGFSGGTAIGFLASLILMGLYIMACKGKDKIHR